MTGQQGTGHSPFRSPLHRLCRPAGVWLSRAAGAIICVWACECSQVLADFLVAAGKVVTIPSRLLGPVMTVTYEPPRLNRIGSPHALTLTRREGSNADVGSFQAAYGNLFCGP